MKRPRITCDDLEVVGQQAVAALVSMATPAGWDRAPVPGMDWDSRTVVDHLCNTLAFYANHAVTAATEHQPRIRSMGDQDLSDVDLSRSLLTWVHLLSTVLRASPSGSRGWHRLGMADAEGFAALACNELVIHTDDVARAHGRSFEVSPDLGSGLLGRLFPDVEPDESVPSTDLVRWANGRRDLPGRARRVDWRSFPGGPSPECDCVHSEVGQGLPESW